MHEGLSNAPVLPPEIGRRLIFAIITHNLEQEKRVPDRVVFFNMGELVESGPADLLFTAPTHPETRRLLAGKLV